MAMTRPVFLVGRPVFLVGMMGSGKTTVGQGLAGACRRPFCDLDARIERLYGRSVATLFSSAGEAGFRAAERHALSSLLDEPGFADRGCVVATGGGAVLAAEHRAMMRAVGTVVLLDVGVDTLLRRLAEGAATRPLLTGADPRATLEQLWASRRDAYHEGAVVVPAEDAADEVVARIVALLRGQGDA